jgi:hypothetical protein
VGESVLIPYSLIDKPVILFREEIEDDRWRPSRLNGFPSHQSGPSALNL